VHLVDFLIVAGKGRENSEFSDWDILTQVSFSCISGYEVLREYALLCVSY
jgi:hypothetical protein